MKKNNNNNFLKVDWGDGLKPSGIRYLSKNCFYAQNSENGTFAKALNTDFFWVLRGAQIREFPVFINRYALNVLRG